MLNNQNLILVIKRIKIQLKYSILIKQSINRELNSLHSYKNISQIIKYYTHKNFKIVISFYKFCQKYLRKGEKPFLTFDQLNGIKFQIMDDFMADISKLKISAIKKLCLCLRSASVSVFVGIISTNISDRFLKIMIYSRFFHCAYCT